MNLSPINLSIMWSWSLRKQLMEKVNDSDPVWNISAKWRWQGVPITLGKLHTQGSIWTGFHSMGRIELDKEERNCIVVLGNMWTNAKTWRSWGREWANELIRPAHMEDLNIPDFQGESYRVGWGHIIQDQKWLAVEVRFYSECKLDLNLQQFQ